MAWSPKDFDRLDPKLFKAFMAASETNNFTVAADMACMTQGGVSQHILKLEQQIGLPLFKRIGRQVTLTDTGEKLVKYIKSYLAAMDNFMDSIIKSNNQISGLVTYAMPASCLLSPHFPKLLKKRLHYDGIELNVKIQPTEEVIRTILADEADFGFVTQKVPHPDLAYTNFCDEEYVLACPPRWFRNIRKPEDIKQLKYIQYPGFHTYCNLWMPTAFNNCQRFPHLSLTYSGHGSTIETAIVMVRGQLGVSFFPRHCISSYLDTGELIEYKLDYPILNDVSIVKPKNHLLPKRVETVIGWFLHMTTEQT